MRSKSVDNSELTPSLKTDRPNLPGNTTRSLKKPIRFGVVADLHYDLMHDGIDRMKSFLSSIIMNQTDAIIQLGDFAYPNANNKEIINLFNQAHERSLHVIGNHDTDSGHTKQMCLDIWGMPAPYYIQKIDWLSFLVLDGNDLGSPTHKGGYPSYIGDEQIEWLRKKLEMIDGPIIVFCHQPLAGNSAVDNAVEIQSVLEKAADKIILSINGHSHIDDLLHINGISYMHVNSASYYWVGAPYQHDSYPKKVHDDYPWISYTCPYSNALFAMFTVNPNSLKIGVEGQHSQWVGKSPADLGYNINSDLKHGEQIVPKIINRFF